MNAKRYDQEIAPLIKELVDACRHAGVHCILSFEVDGPEPGTSMTDCHKLLPKDRELLHPCLREIERVIDRRKMEDRE